MHSIFRALPVIAIVVATPVAAKPFAGSTEPVRVAVSHRDLDLTDAADVATLDQRMRGAVRRACPVATRDLREKAHARQCQHAAREQASSQVKVAIVEAQANRVRFASNIDEKAVAAQ